MTKHTASYFNPELTKKIVNQIALKDADSTNYDLIDAKYHRQQRFSKVEITIPIYTLPAHVFQTEKQLNARALFPDLQVRLGIINDYVITVALPIHTLKLFYQGYGDDQTLTETQVLFEPIISFTKDNSTPMTIQLTSLNDYHNYQNSFIHAYTQAPLIWLRQNIDQLGDEHLNKVLDTYLSNVTVNHQLTKQATIFKDTLLDLLPLYATNNDFLNLTMHNAGNYNLSLKNYHQLAEKLLTLSLTTQQQQAVISSNEFLLLTTNLTELKNNKPNIPVVSHHDVTTEFKTQYSADQLAAITSSEPLSLLQSVAGSGKSHTILGRVQYLLNCGVNPKDITVLSFTNAAANHIKNSVNVNINSLTISKLIHDLYQLNLPQQGLSILPTLINSIQSKLSYQDINAYELVNVLNDLKVESSTNTIAALHFIVENYNMVMSLLNDIQQTTLELEELITYLNLDTWQQPYNSKYLIIDEVQDTSVFQFLFLMHYAKVRNSNVFFVGDASQTLYEFRGAKPTILNALESSNIFAIYKLQTNYRSKPGILVYANQLLSSISANQYANLRLNANGYDQYGNSQSGEPDLTIDNFKEQVNYHQVKSTSKKILENVDFVTKLYQDNLDQQIKTNLNRGQQTAFLMPTNKMVASSMAALINLYPEATVEQLTKQKINSIQILSKYLAGHAQELQFMPVENIPTIISNYIHTNIKSLTDWTFTPETQETFYQTLAQALNSFWKVAYPMYCDHKITQAELISSLENTLIKTELKFNDDANDFFNGNDVIQSQKAENADLVVSTMHSAKGLEFDHTVLLMPTNSRLKQEDRRLYYVALTRAKTSETIFEVTKQDNSILQLDYDNALMDLAKRRSNYHV